MYLYNEIELIIETILLLKSVLNHLLDDDITIILNIKSQFKRSFYNVLCKGTKCGQKYNKWMELTKALFSLIL